MCPQRKLVQDKYCIWNSNNFSVSFLQQKSPYSACMFLVCLVAPIGASGCFWSVGVQLFPSSKRWCGFIQLRSLFPELCSEGHLPAAGIQGCRERCLYPAKPKLSSDPDYSREERMSLGWGPSNTCTPHGTGECRALSSITSHRTNSTGWRGKYRTDVTFQSMQT